MFPPPQPTKRSLLSSLCIRGGLRPVLQGGDSVCQIGCHATSSVLQLKAKVEIEAGLKAETFSLYLPSQEEPLGESQTVSACGMPSELYAIMLQKVVIADAAGVPASALTDEQLEKACSSPEAQAGDIIVLAGCAQVRNLSCLVWLESTHTLDISGCIRMEAATVPIAGLK